MKTSNYTEEISSGYAIELLTNDFSGEYPEYLTLHGLSKEYAYVLFKCLAHFRRVDGTLSNIHINYLDSGVVARTNNTIRDILQETIRQCSVDTTITCEKMIESMKNLNVMCEIPEDQEDVEYGYHHISREVVAISVKNYTQPVKYVPVLDWKY